jgi:hypothetical protein
LGTRQKMLLYEKTLIRLRLLPDRLSGGELAAPLLAVTTQSSLVGADVTRGQRGPWFVQAAELFLAVVSERCAG